MRYLWIACFLLCSFLGMKSQQTRLLTAEKHNEYGLVYSLPLTAFQVEIVAVKEIKLAGPYSKYSKLFTSNVSVIDKDEVNWTIESVNVTPYGVADPDKRYLMQLKPGALTFICVAEDGMLLAVNKEIESPAVKTLEIQSVEGTPYTGQEYLEFVNEDFISAQSSYKQAQILAEEIMEIRDARISLTRGTAETMPTDGRQLELMLESLQKQEKALTNAFTGSSWKEKVVRTFTILPDQEGKSVLCRLSQTEGIVEADDYSGDPVYINITVTEDAVLPVDSKGEEKKLPKDAVIYSIPGEGTLTLTYKGKELFEKSFAMSQFGTVFGLNPSVFTDKKEPSYAIFDPATGALIELATMK